VNVNVESLLELCWLLEHERTAVRDHTADVIRKTTVGERDSSPTFDDDNFGTLVNSAEPGSGGHTAGYTTNNDDGVRE